MMKSTMRLAVVAACSLSMALFAAGCGKDAVKTDQGVAGPAAVDRVAPSTPAASSVTAAKAPAMESLDSKPSGNMYGKISEGRTTGPMLPIYYEYDKADVRADQRGRMENNASFLKGAAIAIRIEGNCDERGTNEYNMALGERRAQSAMKYLANLGVETNRLQTVSYGEEKPLAQGQDDAAWSKNRRADFVVVQ